MGNTQRKIESANEEQYPIRQVPRARVLVVDDQPSVGNSLADVLRDDGCEVIQATNGMDAVQMVVEQSPAVVFLDIWMPGWDGIETLEKIKQLSPATEVIMISGHATISNALEATKRGAFDFIEKPLDIASILLSLSRALERRGLLHPSNEQRTNDADNNTNGGEESLLKHQGAFSRICAGKNLGQRTLAKSTILYGQCLHSGQKSGLVLEPLPQNSGIHFARIGNPKAVPAYVDFVESTSFATTVRTGAVKAQTIEHLMAALRAYGISNLLIKCNDEVPIFDGSALEFCRVIEEIGITEQGGEWFELAVPEAYTVVSKGKNGQAAETITIEPSDGFSVFYELNYPDPIGQQTFEYRFTGPESFKSEIAPARTFGFVKDIEKLQRAGLAAGGRLDNFVLIGEDRIVNTTLRFPNELVRHKILDIVGDLFLIGRPLRGKVTARMTGHSDNINLVREISSRLLAH